MWLRRCFTDEDKPRPKSVGCGAHGTQGLSGSLAAARIELGQRL